MLFDVVVDLTKFIYFCILAGWVWDSDRFVFLHFQVWDFLQLSSTGSELGWRLKGDYFFDFVLYDELYLFWSGGKLRIGVDLQGLKTGVGWIRGWVWFSWFRKVLRLWKDVFLFWSMKVACLLCSVVMEVDGCGCCLFIFHFLIFPHLMCCRVAVWILVFWVLGFGAEHM